MEKSAMLGCFDLFSNLGNEKLSSSILSNSIN